MNLACRDIWKGSGVDDARIPIDADLMTCSELVLSPDESRLIERKRYPGENTLAMVAWKMILRTPGMLS